MKGICKIALATILWGIAYPLIKHTVANVAPIQLGFFRFFLASIFFVAYTKSKPLSGIKPSDRHVLFKMGFWGVFILILGTNYGLRYAPGTIASIITGTTPIFTIFLAAFWLKETVNKKQILSIFIAMIGLTLIAINSKDIAPEQSYSTTVFGTILILLPQLAWAIYGVYGKTIANTYNWEVVCRDTFCIGTGLLFLPALIEYLLCGPGHWNTSAYLSLFYLFFFNSVVTYALWNSALLVTPITTANLLLYLQPIAGTLLSLYLFNERLNISSLAGTIILFAALTLAIFSSPIDSNTQE